MLYSQTTSAKSDHSSVQMFSRCMPDSAKRENSFMLCCLIIFQKIKTREAVSSCQAFDPA